MTTTEVLLRDNIHSIFRRCFIKRRSATTGLYESTWQDITQYVKSWGNFTIAIDDQRLNRFTHSGISLRVINNEGKFHEEQIFSSLWYGYLTRVRSLVKIEAGYYDNTGTEYPTTTTQGIFIMDNEIIQNPATNEVTINCKSIVSPFQETRASEIDGITTGLLTASDILGKIRDATDGSGSYLFRDFITSTSWTIAPTTNIYSRLNTTTILENYTVWELINQLAEAENFVVFATREGGIEFKDRNPHTTTSQYSFSGGLFPTPNIISMTGVKEAVNKLYTHVRLKFLEDDTATSYISRGDDVVLNATNTAWKYGRKTYELENLWLDSTSADIVATKLVNEYSNLKIEVELESKFHPEINILDRVDVSYRENSLEGASLWDAEDWASSTASLPSDGMSWDEESGTSIEWWNKNFKVLSKQTNLDNLTTKFILREAESI